MKSLKHFLRDWRPALVGFFLALAFINLALYIALANDAMVTTLLYISMVALVIFALGMVIIFIRSSNYLKSIQLQAANKPGRPDLSPPDSIAQAWEDLSWRQQQHYQELLLHERALRQEQGDFFTQWVHQIKTPMTVLSLLADTRDLPEIRTELKRIDRAVANALGFSRLNDLAADFLVQEQDLLALCQRALVPFEPLIQQKQIEVQLNGQSGRVLADSKWLIFVLDQLFSNALKYCPNHAHIHCLAQNKSLTISDNGPGIPAEELERVWNRSFTGASGRRDLSATGMGLWLAKRLCQAMRIEISIQSKINHGTSVHLHFGR